MGGGGGGGGGWGEANARCSMLRPLWTQLVLEMGLGGPQSRYGYCADHTSVCPVGVQTPFDQPVVYSPY